MSVLFSGVVAIPSGAQESAVMAVPGNIKQPGVPLTLLLAVDDTTVPNGTTMLTLFLSLDGGTTFRSASMTCVHPATWRGAGPHFWRMTYCLGENDNPTHAKFSIAAPAAFLAQVIMEAA